MRTNEDNHLKIKFDHDWCGCCLHATDDIDINVMTNTNSNDDHYWISLQLPHIIIDKQGEKNEENWWYRKQFEWKTNRPNSDQRVHLIFESLNDQHINGNNDYSSVDTFTVWLNEIQIFSDSFQLPKISIDLTEQLAYKDELGNNNSTNTLVVCCANASLSLHTYLLIPSVIIDAIEQHNIDISSEKICTALPFRKNRVLDYLVNFYHADGRFDIILNPKLNSPTVANQNNSPNIVLSQDDNHTIERPIYYNEEIDRLHVPRLAIVMLIVGTRGDVQPFVAFGQTLRAAGHRVRLATHEKFRKFVREHDLEFYPLACNPDDLMSFVVKNGGVVPSMSSIVAGDLMKKRRDIANILKSTWLACTENDDETSAPFTAEVIIANPPSFGHIHCAQKLQIPLHMMFTMPWSATTVFPHAFFKTDHEKAAVEKLNLLSYSVIDTLTWSSMHDLANDLRRDTLGLPPLHTRQALRVLMDEEIPHTYCWSPTLVPRPFDWPSHINVSGYFFLNTDTDQYKPPDDLVAFLGLNDDKQDKEKLSPPIYIGFGSITGCDSRRLFHVILDALARTGYRALLAGFDNDKLPDNVFNIGDVPHDWLFQHVSAVCHHGGAGTTAAGLRAGKPTIVVPFFGDQFFWGHVVAKNGAGPLPIPGKSITVEQLVEAFKLVHETRLQNAAESIRDALSLENGCETALRMFHAQLPLSRMHSDLEPTFAACYRIDEYDLQVSRPVAQVLIAAGALDESQFRSHATRNWKSIYDYRVHVPTSGVLKHTQKAFSHIFIHTTGDMRRAISSNNLVVGIIGGVGDVCKDIGKGVGHLSIGVISLYGELTDVLDRVPSLYDPYSDLDAHERPRVIDFKSGAKAARLSVAHGWKDGVTGFIRKPRVGYRRKGILGGATGVLVATANGVIKPAAGSLASVTWLGRGMYAGIKKKRRKNGKNGEPIVINKLSVQSSFSLSSSHNDEEHKLHEDDEDDDDDDDDVPRNIKFAAVVSGYPATVCQQILDEFEEVKKSQQQIASSSSNQTHKRQRRHLFQRYRSHSDSAL